MDNAFLTLGPKNFLTGIASSAHTEAGGLFFKAAGITALYDAGGVASPENGTLQPGPSPTDFTGSVIVDTIFAGVATSFSGAALLFMLGTSGHFYRKTTGAAAPTDLRSGTPITNPANGMTVWGPASGTPLCYFWRQDKIGTWDMSGSYPTGWNDSAYSITQGNNSTTLKPVHQFVGNVYYGNGDVIGAITDAGSGSASHSSNVLDFPSRQLVTGITDDSQYLVIAATENASAQDTYAMNWIYFWDTFSASWNRQWPIRDPFIWAIKSEGGVIYAFGRYGVYAGTFQSGFQKLPPTFNAFGTTADVTAGYGSSRATIYNGGAFLFGTDSTIDSFGKLQPDVPSAYHKPFSISSGRPSFIFAGLDSGRVFVATTTPKLYAYDFNNATRSTGNTVQTVYIPLPDKKQVNRIDLIFAEPLASGDAISASLYTDEDTSPISFGSATYATNGAVRRVSLITKTPAVAEEQLSLLLTFTSGAVKLKRVKFYGPPMTV